MTTIKAFVSNDVAHLVISGRLVHGEGASSGMQRAILRCSGSDFKLLVVDLGDVDQMDTAGLSVLMVAYSAAHSLGARFALARVPQAISRFAHHCRTGQRLPAIPALRKHVRAIRRPAGWSQHRLSSGSILESKEKDNNSWMTIRLR
jgi:anti-anti-sigma factor